MTIEARNRVLDALFIYRTAPYDFFQGWSPLTDEDISDDPAAFYAVGVALDALKRHAYRVHMFDTVGETWVPSSWRSISRGPLLMRLPGNGDSDVTRYVVLWKISHAGTCYLVSPVRLPWLDDDCLITKAVEEREAGWHIQNENYRLERERERNEKAKLQALEF